MLNKQMQKYIRVSIWLVACLMVSSLFAQDMPNIVVVLADDIGPGDIGFYHRERTGKPELIPTPNLDRLISEGMRFDDASMPANFARANAPALSSNPPAKTSKTCWPPPSISEILGVSYRTPILERTD